jgi:hypothetical protein
MPRRYEFKSSCPAPAILYVCRLSRYVATRLQHYEKLFGTVWFDYNRDTLFLDFGHGFPLRNAYTEDDLSMDDLERVRFLAFYSHIYSDSLQLARLMSTMMARIINLERVFLCSFQSRYYFSRLSGGNYSDLVFTAQCPLIDRCIGPHVQMCSADALHIVNCSCFDEAAVAKQNWYGRHSSLPSITLPQPGPQILWRHVLNRPVKDRLITNARWMGLRVLQ